jgi:hypothetical protein
MMNLRFALLALSTLLPVAACGGTPSGSGEPLPMTPNESNEALEDGGEAVVGDVVSVDFAGGRYEFVQPLAADGDGLGVLLNVQLGRGQGNAVEAPLADGATYLELFLGLSPEGAQAPAWLVDDHAEALARRGRTAGELRELSLARAVVDKSYSTSLCSTQILGPDRYTADVGYYSKNSLSGRFDYKLNGGYGVSERGAMGICNDDDASAAIWYDIVVDGQVVGGDTRQWFSIPAGGANWMYYEAPGFPKMRVVAEGDDFHARAKWVKLHFEGYEGPF